MSRSGVEVGPLKPSIVSHSERFPPVPNQVNRGALRSSEVFTRLKRAKARQCRCNQTARPCWQVDLPKYYSLYRLFVVPMPAELLMCWRHKRLPPLHQCQTQRLDSVSTASRHSTRRGCSCPKKHGPSGLLSIPLASSTGSHTHEFYPQNPHESQRLI